MERNGLFNERNQAFFARAASRAFGNALFSGNPLRAARNAAKAAGIAVFQRKQGRRRAAAESEGRTVPGILIASVTRRCNLRCAGCYSQALRPDASAELGDERFLELFREAAELGVGTIMSAGGEPLLRRRLLEGAAGIPGIVFPVFTNGSLLDEGYLDLFSRARMLPILSIEGDAAFTAERRGTGVHERVMENCATLRKRGALFGFSVTLTSKNADSVLSERFLDGVAASGAAVLFLIEYVPVAAGSGHLVLSDAQKADLSRPGRFDRYPFMTVSLPGDEEAFGGCLAAGRGFVHLADDGALEACPFAPYSDTNAAALGLRGALDSPLMKAIRARHSELTETKGGCALWNKKGWIASLGACAAERTKEAETA